jgi:hypothetical protein
LPEVVGYLRAQSADLAVLKQALNGLVVSSQVMNQLLGPLDQTTLIYQQALAAAASTLAGSSSLPGPQSPARRMLAGDRQKEQPPLKAQPFGSPKKPTR